MPRERNQKSYEQALVKRYHHLHEVKRIERHRHLPAPIYKVCFLPSGMSAQPTAVADSIMSPQHCICVVKD